LETTHLAVEAVVLVLLVGMHLEQLAAQVEGELLLP
jgi:hypothetical protein